jgi:hypothetical protein
VEADVPLELEFMRRRGGVGAVHAYGPALLAESRPLPECRPCAVALPGRITHFPVKCSHGYMH